MVAKKETGTATCGGAIFLSSGLGPHVLDHEMGDGKKAMGKLESLLSRVNPLKGCTTVLVRGQGMGGKSFTEAR